MRASLRPGILKTLAYNASHRLTGLGLFEVGHVYRQPAEAQRLPDEREYLAVALAGREAGEAVAVWSALADALAARDYALVAESVPGLHPSRTARIEVSGTPVGHVGEVDPGVLESYEVPERVAWLEVDLDTLLALPHGDKPYRGFSRYPSSDIDLAFEVDEGTPADAVGRCLRDAAGDLLVDLSLFDVYRGDAVRRGGAASPSPCASRPPTGRSLMPRWPSCASVASMRFRARCLPPCGADARPPVPGG